MNEAVTVGDVLSFIAIAGGFAVLGVVALAILGAIASGFHH